MIRSDETEAPVKYETRDSVALITLNRPAKLNAMNTGMRDMLLQFFQAVEDDPTVSVAILTGAGSRAFCAGRDLAEADADEQQDFLPMIGDKIKLTKPVIAAVNGLAYGAGWFLVQGCDLCVASTDATFALPEARVGRAPAWACWLHGMLPQKIMLELLMTGNPITATRAYEIGLVNHLIADADVLPTAMALAKSIVSAAPLSVAATKQMVYATAGVPRDEALRQSFEIFEPVYRSHDAYEGRLAFREKRAPQWTGR